MNLTKPQKEFLCADEREVLFGGGVGCGKTYAQVRLALNKAIFEPNSRIAFITQYFTQYRFTIEGYFSRILGYGPDYVYKTAWYYPSYTFKNGSRIEFYYFKDDVGQKIGEADLICFDEVGNIGWNDYLSLKYRSKQIRLTAMHPKNSDHWLLNKFEGRLITSKSLDNPYMKDQIIELLPYYMTKTWA